MFVFVCLFVCLFLCETIHKTIQILSASRLCLTVFNQSLSQFAERHNFPPDVTSSFANLALGAVLLLGSYSDQLSLVFQEWSLYNANFSRLIQHAGQFSYRPLSADVNGSVIDSRTYFSIRQFLYRRNRTVLENDLFITNWVRGEVELWNACACLSVYGCFCIDV